MFITTALIAVIKQDILPTLNIHFTDPFYNQVPWAIRQPGGMNSKLKYIALSLLSLCQRKRLMSVLMGQPESSDPVLAGN